MNTVMNILHKLQIVVKRNQTSLLSKVYTWKPLLAEDRCTPLAVHSYTINQECTAVMQPAQLQPRDHVLKR
jgi:hypothetical protein